MHVSHAPKHFLHIREAQLFVPRPSALIEYVELVGGNLVAIDRFAFLHERPTRELSYLVIQLKVKIKSGSGRLPIELKVVLFPIQPIGGAKPLAPTIYVVISGICCPAFVFFHDQDPAPIK